MSPESGLRPRYNTMALVEICEPPVKSIAADDAHLYLWVPSTMLPEGLKVGPGGVGWYFSDATWKGPMSLTVRRTVDES